ncbi:MAG: hypothetical protein WC807_20125 [Hyphomicrobium sp.]
MIAARHVRVEQDRRLGRRFQQRFQFFAAVLHDDRAILQKRARHAIGDRFDDLLTLALQLRHLRPIAMDRRVVMDAKLIDARCVRLAEFLAEHVIHQMVA